VDPNFVFVYSDDIPVVSATMEEHIVHVKKVLHRLDIRLTSSKCKFSQQETEYLGFNLSPEGMKPYNLRVQAV